MGGRGQGRNERNFFCHLKVETYCILKRVLELELWPAYWAPRRRTDLTPRSEICSGLPGSSAFEWFIPAEALVSIIVDASKEVAENVCAHAGAS